MRLSALLLSSIILIFVACLPSPASPQGPAPQPTATVEALTESPADNMVSAAPGAAPEIGLRLMAAYLVELTTITHAGDGSNRLFVLERRGKIRVIENGRLQAEPFLDLTDIVNTAKDLEQGLLGLAFHPAFPDDPRLFVYYTNRDDDTVLVSYTVTPDARQANKDSAQILLTIEQPFTNHNGGQLAFGPDGYLYIGVGEGGLSRDPGPDSFLGKILRLDIEATETYAIPADNPFVGAPNTRPEIWSLGFRNPWRFSFDRATGDLFIADVGQNLYEEIDIEPAGSGGRNYGWPVMEGFHCYESETCHQNGLTMPVAEYERKDGCSVTGGYVYRGRQYPALEGVYFFGDYCTGKIWAMPSGGQPVEALDTILNISSFGEDEAGELYVADFFQGKVYQIVTPSAETQTNWPGAWPLAEQPTERLQAEFTGDIRLVGYNARQPFDSPGGVVELTLFWQGRTIPETGNVFVQVRDQNNATVAQADHPLYIHQDMLTSDGAMLRDGATLPLPPDLPAGTYRILVGFYNPETSERLPVVNDSTGENAAILSEFVVK